MAEPTHRLGPLVLHHTTPCEYQAIRRILRRSCKSGGAMSPYFHKLMNLCRVLPLAAETIGRPLHLVNLDFTARRP